LIFLGTELDSFKILSAITLAGDVELYLDATYDSPIAQAVRELDEASIANILKVRSLFICLNPYSIYGPQLFQIKSGSAAGKFAIDEIAGGPLYSLILPANFEERGKHNISCGMFSPPAKWLNPLTNCLEEPNDWVIQGYKEIVRRMKSVVVPHHFHKRIWAGPDAIALIESGGSVVRGFGLD
jgi:hypothetical protein